MNTQTKLHEDQRSLKETLYLLRSPRNAERLLTALYRARTQEVASSSVEKIEKLYGLKD